jgi:hypothetical protein
MGGSSMANFMAPYVMFIMGAAYNVLQTLEGLGLTSINYVVRDPNGNIIDSYWSPYEAVLPLFGLILFALIIFIILACAAGYVIGRKSGACVALSLLAIPGIASMTGLWEVPILVPDSFVVGRGGTLGSSKGMLPLVTMELLFGWCLTIIATDLLNLRDRFRHLFDHIWYAMAITAGLFFVWDSNSIAITDGMRELNEDARQASNYLLRQVISYEIQCRSDSSLGDASCKWASQVQGLLSEYAAYGEKIFHSSGPKLTSDIYDPLRSNISEMDILTIRREIRSYNNRMCPEKKIDERAFRMTKPSATCQSPPATFCTAFTEPLDGVRDDSRILIRTTALASECIIPTLVKLRLQQEKLAAKITVGSKYKHLRWLFFIALSFIAGGKVANSTARGFEFDRRSDADEHRLRTLIIFVWRQSRKSILTIWTLTQRLRSKYNNLFTYFSVK